MAAQTLFANKVDEVRFARSLNDVGPHRLVIHFYARNGPVGCEFLFIAYFRWFS